MSRLLVVLATAAAMRAAFERGDIDEAARQGQRAGAGVVAAALTADARSERLAGIAAATEVEGREDLLELLALTAAGPDWRTALPAARAAKAIATGLLRDTLADQSPDDLAAADLETWRVAWAALALRGDRWIELRVLALDVTAALARAIALWPATDRPQLGGAAEVGVDLPTALADPDPAFVAAAQALRP